MRKELDRKYVKQLDTGDKDGLRGIYKHYRDTCIDGGGSPAWARATSVLVLELLDRLEEKEGTLRHGFRAGDKVRLKEEVYLYVSESYTVEKEGVISTIWMPEDEMGYDFGVTFTNPKHGQWELDFSAHDLEKIEDNG